MQIYMYMYQILFLFNDFQNLEKLRMLKTLSLAENQIDKIGNTILCCFCNKDMCYFKCFCLIS